MIGGGLAPNIKVSRDMYSTGPFLPSFRMWGLGNFDLVGDAMGYFRLRYVEYENLERKLMLTGPTALVIGCCAEIAVSVGQTF